MDINTNPTMVLSHSSSPDIPMILSGCTGIIMTLRYPYGLRWQPRLGISTWATDIIIYPSYGRATGSMAFCCSWGLDVTMALGDSKVHLVHYGPGSSVALKVYLP